MKVLLNQDSLVFKEALFFFIVNTSTNNGKDNPLRNPWLPVVLAPFFFFFFNLIFLLLSVSLALFHNRKCWVLPMHNIYTIINVSIFFFRSYRRISCRHKLGKPSPKSWKNGVHFKHMSISSEVQRTTLVLGSDTGFAAFSSQNLGLK